MEKIWQGHLSGKISKAAESFNASISFDKKMYKEDIEGSMVHAEMLGRYGIIEEGKAEKIISALSSILSDIEEGKLEITEEKKPGYSGAYQGKDRKSIRRYDVSLCNNEGSPSCL